VRTDQSRFFRRDEIAMRREREEKRIAPLEIHPLECLRIPRFAGLDRDAACFPILSHRDVLAILRLKRDSPVPAIYHAERGGAPGASHALQLAVDYRERIAAAEFGEPDRLQNRDWLSEAARPRLVHVKKVEIGMAAGSASRVVIEQ